MSQNVGGPKGHHKTTGSIQPLLKTLVSGTESNTRATLQRLPLSARLLMLVFFFFVNKFLAARLLTSHEFVNYLQILAIIRPTKSRKKNENILGFQG